MTRQFKKKRHSETKSIPSISNTLIQYYYSPLYGGIHTVREILEDSIILSYPQVFLNDALTTNKTIAVDPTYFGFLILLDNKNLDSYEFLCRADLSEYYKPYRVKEDLINIANFYYDYNLI